MFRTIKLEPRRAAVIAITSAAIGISLPAAGASADNHSSGPAPARDNSPAPTQPPNRAAEAGGFPQPPPNQAGPPSERLPEPRPDDYGAKNFNAPNDAELDHFAATHRAPNNGPPPNTAAAPRDSNAVGAANTANNDRPQTDQPAIDGGYDNGAGDEPFRNAGGSPQ